MNKILLLIDCVFCGWLLWVKILLQKPRLPVEQLPLILAGCAALHCLLSLFFLWRGDRPGGLYLFSGLAAYGIFFYRVFSVSVAEAFTLGGIGFVLVGLAVLTSAFES